MDEGLRNSPALSLGRGRSEVTFSSCTTHWTPLPLPVEKNPFEQQPLEQSARLPQRGLKTATPPRLPGGQGGASRPQ